MTTKNAIVYARVSTDDQADKGFSLSAQVDAGRKYADAHGMTVSHELIDDGVSGAMAFSERPAGATAWALLRSGKAHALIVQNVDRLSRDVVDLLVTIRALLRAGVEVHCLDLGRVTSEYDMLHPRGWQGSVNGKNQGRTIRGVAKLTQGFIVGGRRPYGYDHLRDEQRRVVNFTVNEEEAAQVRLIFQWYTKGDKDGGPYSLYEIAARLNASGIPKRGQAWRSPVISQMIKNTVYKGEYRYTASGIDGDAEQTFSVTVPAIVDLTTWELAQLQKERNARKAKRNAQLDYLLTGIVKCGCGYSMAGHSRKRKGERTLYYTCNSRILFRKSVRQCVEGSMRADVLEAATWDAVLSILNDPIKLKPIFKRQRRELAEQEPQRAELESVLVMLAKARADADKLAQALARLDERGQVEGAVGDALQRQIYEVNERHKRLVARRDELEAILSQRHFTDEAIAGMVEFAERCREGAENANHATKRRLLDTLDARIIVKRKGANGIHSSAKCGELRLRVSKLMRRSNAVDDGDRVGSPVGRRSSSPTCGVTIRLSVLMVFISNLLNCSHVQWPKSKVTPLRISILYHPQFRRISSRLPAGSRASRPVC